MSKSKQRRDADPANWPLKLLSIRRLRLDPDNPRFASSVRRPTQQELIKDLIDHENVVELLSNIARLGFFPNEPLVAVKDGGNLIIVEGNRRLAALKLLDNPELAPAEHQSRIRQHADRSSRIIDRVPVVLAPSRASIVPLLIARHKGEVTKSWTTVMQARYLQGRFEERKNIDAVVDETGLERSEVVRALRDAKVYDVIRSLPLPPETEHVVSDPRKFSYTNLQRMLESSPVQQALGMSFDDVKGFVTSLPADRFVAGLTRIVTDVANGTITSRTHNVLADVESYVKDLQRDLGKPKPSKGEKTTADELVDPSKIAPKPETLKRKAPRAKRPQLGLIPKGFRVDIEDDRIEAIVAELKSLKITQFPNAVAVTFRSLLDMAVTKYLQDCGELSACIAKHSKKQIRPADWTPSLNQLLNHILETKTIPLGPEARKGLRKFVSDTNDSLTMESLHWFTHVRYVPPTVDELRSFWTKLAPLLQLTLQKP